MVVAIQPGAKLGPIGHVISFMANSPPWVFYGIHAITPSNGIYGLRPYPAVIGLLGQFPLHQPPAFCLLGASRPSSNNTCIQGHPFHYWGFGLNGLFGPFRPPTAPTAHGP
ncbi:hypothetical protein O181_111838 [Austropuccinia psidii MF-1]|uniref:Uncharacterized protein n=1 Tax=Austropuccinia psidii MF-1 TaxID=1389203 RepID=A0A9Q3JZB4_9BASI|nr:hypothetical protein [Austropuccinia psidii MF-1]